MKQFDVEAKITISISKTVLAKDEADARRKAGELSLPDVLSCSPGDAAFWDVGELDGEPIVTSVGKTNAALGIYT